MLKPALFVLAFSAEVFAQAPAEMHPPAVPLITHDPYFSVWSMRDKLTDDWPKHWSGGTMGMTGLVWVDGKAYRWCGPMPQDVPAAHQDGIEIGMTSSRYAFTAGDVKLKVTFCSPLGPGNMDRASRPVSTVTFLAKADDGKTHDIHVYLDLTGEWCSNDPNDQINWSRHKVTGNDVLSMGKVDQPVLEHTGDQRKIDWGRVYLAGGDESAVMGHQSSRATFAKSGHVGTSDDLRMPRSVSDDWPVLAAAIDLGVKRGNIACLAIGYDEGEAIELFERKLKPFWTTRFTTGIANCLAESVSNIRNEVGSGESPISIFDAPFQREFRNAAEAVGGPRYANLLALAYRQVLAGHGMAADWDGTPLMFAKENTSNGCISTVDVIYPACPFFLYHNPEMLRAQLLPLMQYSASPRWKFPFAPHDLGQYPKANGQVYGGGERTEEDQMPVEESGNMLIMLGALAKVEPKESVEFCQPYWATLEKWANYLKDNGLDPANQLCTDDFAGHLARNVNLSAKTVVALGAYAQLLAAAGKQEEAKTWRKTAEDFARHWQTSVYAAGGESTPLVFGDAGKGTWSQKYNLVWDRALDMHLFPPELYKSEMAFYRKKLNKYGLPLDSRRTYTKLDWTSWTACLTGNRQDFDAIMEPVLNWANASPPPSRVPLSDWYETTDGKTQGMYARTVVGGLWMPLLIDKINGAK